MIVEIILLVVGLISGLVLGAGIHHLGIVKGLSVGEKMVSTWTKTEKSLQKAKTENIESLMEKRARVNSGVGIITDG